MKNRTIGILTQFTVLGLLMTGQSFAATGGSFYANQLGSVTESDTSFGRTSDFTSAGGYTKLQNLTEATDLQAGDWGGSMAKVYNTVADQSSFMEWDLPSGTFNAQTVIAYRNTQYPFDNGSPWHLELFDGSTWKPISVGGAGTPGDTSIAMGNTGVTGTKIRAIYDNMNFTAGAYFMSMGELLVLPDSLQKVTNSYTASASSIFSTPAYAAPNAIDNQESSADNHSWFSAPGDSNAWYTLSFTSPASINALLLSKWDNFGGYTNAIVDVYVNGTLGGGWTDGTKVAGNVDMTSPLNFSSFNVFKFDSTLDGVNSLSLKFISGGRTSDGGQGLAEIIPLTIPEPSSAALLAMAVGGMLRRRRENR